MALPFYSGYAPADYARVADSAESKAGGMHIFLFGVPDIATAQVL
jgi:hypothetical protein